MPALKDWLEAFRLRTLPLAIGSILVGNGLASYSGHFDLAIMTAALVTAVLLQILSNLANDLGDHQHGTDNSERVGPARSVQSGRISTALMRRAMIVTGTLSLASGVCLIFLALGSSLVSLAFLVMGLLAIVAAVRYTYGSNPYGYAGLGDLSVFLFFGPVAVAGMYYLQTRSVQAPVILPAAAFGLLSMGVLNVNNMRDIVNDAASGKRTLAVRLGRDDAKSYHAILVSLALILLAVFTATHFRGMPQWGFLITTSVLASHLRVVLRNHDPAALDPELKRLALGTFATALAFAIGLWMV